MLLLYAATHYGHVLINQLCICNEKPLVMLGHAVEHVEYNLGCFDCAPTWFQLCPLATVMILSCNATAWATSSCVLGLQQLSNRRHSNTRQHEKVREQIHAYLLAAYGCWVCAGASSSIQLADKSTLAGHITGSQSLKFKTVELLRQMCHRLFT